MSENLRFSLRGLLAVVGLSAVVLAASLPWLRPAKPVDKEEAIRIAFARMVDWEKHRRGFEPTEVTPENGWVAERVFQVRVKGRQAWRVDFVNYGERRGSPWSVDVYEDGSSDVVYTRDVIY